jgi:hypothetical protein
VLTIEITARKQRVDGNLRETGTEGRESGIQCEINHRLELDMYFNINYLACLEMQNQKKRNINFLVNRGGRVQGSIPESFRAGTGCFEHSFPMAARSGMESVCRVCGGVPVRPVTGGCDGFAESRMKRSRACDDSRCGPGATGHQAATLPGPLNERLASMSASPCTQHLKTLLPKP